MTTFEMSLLFSNIFDPLSHDEEVALETFKKIAKNRRYKSVETRPFFNDEIREKFKVLAKEEGWSITYWLTSSMNKEKMNLSSIDEIHRLESVKFVKRLIDICYDGNATYIGMGGGPISDNTDLSYQQFYKSITELSAYAKQYDNTYLMVEPLDMFAHKKSTIGNLEVTRKLFNSLEKEGYTDNTILCIDTAHFALNEDNLLETINELSKYSNRLHMANAVLDKSNPDYGDNHLPFGNEGFLNKETGKEIINFSKQQKFKEDIVYLTAEVRGKNIDKVWDLEDECYDFLLDISE